MTNLPALKAVDRAFVLAAIAFEGEGGERLWSRLNAPWRDRLRSAWADTLASGLSPGIARELLAREHAAECLPDPDHVHSSWWVRALAEESPAVQLAVSSRTEEPIRSWLIKGLNLDPSDLESASSAMAHPEAVAIALAFWAERLVGGRPCEESDPPVVRALTDQNGERRTRLVVELALSKWAYVRAATLATPKADSQHALSNRRAARLESARDAWIAEGVDPKAGQLGRLDVEHHLDGKEDDLQRLGLVTVARLIADTDPHRLRWALQHLPYSVAKFIRSRTGLKTPLIAGRELVAWERLIWDFTANRLGGDVAALDTEALSPDS